MGFRPEDLCYRIVVSSCEQVSESYSDQRTNTEADWLLLKRERILIAWVPRYKNAWHIIKKDIIASSVRDVKAVNKLKKKFSIPVKMDFTRPPQTNDYICWMRNCACERIENCVVCLVTLGVTPELWFGL